MSNNQKKDKFKIENRDNVMAEIEAFVSNDQQLRIKNLHEEMGESYRTRNSKTVVEALDVIDSSVVLNQIESSLKVLNDWQEFLLLESEKENKKLDSLISFWYRNSPEGSYPNFTILNEFNSINYYVYSQILEVLSKYEKYAKENMSFVTFQMDIRQGKLHLTINLDLSSFIIPGYIGYSMPSKKLEYYKSIIAPNTRLMFENKEEFKHSVAKKISDRNSNSLKYVLKNVPKIYTLKELSLSKYELMQLSLYAGLKEHLLWDFSKLNELPEEEREQELKRVQYYLDDYSACINIPSASISVLGDLENQLEKLLEREKENFRNLSKDGASNYFRKRSYDKKINNNQEYYHLPEISNPEERVKIIQKHLKTIKWVSDNLEYGSTIDKKLLIGEHKSKYDDNIASSFESLVFESVYDDILNEKTSIYQDVEAMWEELTVFIDFLSLNGFMIDDSYKDN